MPGFEPKTPVSLNPPKDDPISKEYLSKCDGTHEGYPTYVAIKGTVFDVSGNKAYAPGASYSGECFFLQAIQSPRLDTILDFQSKKSTTLTSTVFAGKDASKGLGMSSLKPEDAVADYSELSDEHKKVLDDWFTFFSKRYNIVGKVSD